MRTYLRSLYDLPDNEQKKEKKRKYNDVDDNEKYNARNLSPMTWSSHSTLAVGVGVCWMSTNRSKSCTESFIMFRNNSLFRHNFNM